ncbi:MAG: hypothetical protein PHH29_14975 [Desulfuromonadaceae bacterium]|nr:hypothetical protein [Desulfuromonadaceae bacterium]
MSTVFVAGAFFGNSFALVGVGAVLAAGAGTGLIGAAGLAAGAWAGLAGTAGLAADAAVVVVVVAVAAAFVVSVFSGVFTQGPTGLPSRAGSGILTTWGAGAGSSAVFGAS